jgi:hypothetical protein
VDQIMKNEAYDNLRTIGALIAGEPGDLVRRASVYREMYLESGERNVFPLIAAHGSLWAVGFFKKGDLGAKLLSLPYLLIPGSRNEKLRSVAAFAERFKDINRRICAEAYAIYHYTKYYGDDAFIRSEIGDDFADVLCACHRSIDANTEFTRLMRERLFNAFLNWEQTFIVAPALVEAFADLRWGVIVHLAMKLKVDMLYLGRRFPLRFENFASKAERINRGMQAYRRAEEVGLEKALDSLGDYKLMPGNGGETRTAGSMRRAYSHAH